MNRRLPQLLFLLSLLALLVALGPRVVAQDSTGTTTLVSVSSAGVQGNYDSYKPSISADGRFVAFTSYATNLVAGNTNGHYDIFVHDRQTGVTSRVSLSSSGEQGNSDSHVPTISADGRFVAFESYAGNLVAGDTNVDKDVFVHDRQTGATSRVSLSSSGEQGNSHSFSPAISADGRFVAFISSADNLVAGDTNGTSDVFVHDRQTGATSRVSLSSSGEQGDNDSHVPTISADGRFVAFMSTAGNLVAGDANGHYDIFVHDRQTGVTSRVSLSSSGEQGNGDSHYPAISADGRFVAFMSTAGNLVAGDANGHYDIFVHDRQTGVTSRVSLSSSGEQGDNDSHVPTISADGRFVAFESYAGNLVAGDANVRDDIFVHDRQTGITTRVSLSSSGEQGNGNSHYPAISADGRFVAFNSYATNLVAGDTNGTGDVFVHDRGEQGAPGHSITGFILDRAAAPVAGVAVCTQSDACTNTDAFGAFSLNSLAAGSYSLTATKFGYTFTPNTQSITVPPNAVGIAFIGASTGDVPAAILQEAQGMVASADEVLAGAEDDALGVIEEVIYFRGAVANFSIKFVSGLIRGLLDELHAAASNTSELPIHEAFPGWKKAVLKSPTFCKLSNAFVSDVSEAAFSEQAGLKRATRLALNSGLYALAAYNENKCLGDLQEDLILDSVGIGNLLLAHLERPFAQTPVARKIADSRAFLDQQLAILQAAKVPPMSQTVIDGYVADLRARKFANTVYRDQLHDALLTLEAIHAANEAEPWGGDVLQLTLRSAAKFGAEWVADGPGRAAVNGTLLLFDSYMDHKALLESYRMLLVANSTLLKTAPEVVQKVTDNTDAGLAQIAAGQGPNLPHGSILGVKHYSGGQYLDPLALWWQEREAYSWVTIKNTGATPGDFTVVGRYQGETTRLTLPWANLWLRASSDPVRLLPGQSTPVQLIYRTGDLGYSPREARTIGSVPASRISVDLLGVNETGTFHLDFYSNEWQPARAIMTNGVMTFVAPTTETEAAVIDEVLVSAIDGGPGQDYQTGFLWVNNPFDATVPVVLSQPLPGNITVLDSDGGNVIANEIAWSGTVGPLETGFFEYTMDIDSPPGTPVAFPAATLEIIAPDNQALTVTGEEQVVTMPWPVLIDRDTPDWVPPHTAAALTINAANFADAPVNGAFAVEVWTAAGQQVQREEQPLAVAVRSDQQVTFDWPDTLGIGDYEVRGFLILDGNEDQVFADPVAVGAPPPHLSLAISPINDDGTVTLGGVLDYTFTIENAGDMALTNVMAGITLPTDMEVIAISDSGARAGAEIRWPLDTIAAGAFRTLTVQARVPLGFVAPNEGRYLESTPFLTADESPDATGAAVRVLVLGSEGVAAPTVTGFTPTSGPTGASVAISGTAFTGTTTVTFNGVSATSFMVNSATQINTTVPAGATTGKIAITTPGGTATSEADFTVIPAPTITSFSPTSGSVGTVVTITGTALTGATTVKFNSTAATFTVASATQINATVPAGATTGKIAVTTPGGTATSVANFTITAPPTPAIYLSPTGTGKLGVKSFTGADILSYVKATNTWDVFYDGSYVKTAKNVGAFAFQGTDILLGFSAAQAITGLGTVAPQDLVRFTPTSVGYNNTAGAFAWFFDGSDVGLTTSAEAIDALWIDAGGRLYISTTGSGSVPVNSAQPTGAKVNFQDEDVLRFTPSSTGATTAGTWALYWDPTAMTGISAEDINGYWEDPVTGNRFVTILGAFTIGNTTYGRQTGNGKTILRFAPNAAAPGGWAPVEKVTWLAAGATFGSNIDGIELAR